MAIARTILGELPEDFNSAAIDQLVRLYRTAALEIKDLAEKRLVRDARTLTVQAQRSRVLLIEVEEILQQLDADSAAWIAEFIPRHYRVGAARTVAGLKEIGFHGAIPWNPDFHQEALDLLVLDMQDDLLAATEGMLTTQRRVLRRTQLAAATDRAVTERIATGQIAGITTRDVARNIASDLQAQFGDTVLINGRNYRVDKYAELVARTKASEAINAGAINRMVEAGQDLVMVTAHGATDGCGFYEGRVFSISGGHEKYPPISQLPNGGPPFHPNCLHNLAPFVEELASGAERRRGAAIDQRALGKSFRDVERLASG